MMMKTLMMIKGTCILLGMLGIELNIEIISHLPSLNKSQVFAVTIHTCLPPIFQSM